MSSHPRKRATLLDLKEICRAQNLKATPQRLEILRIVSEADNHPDAEEIFHKAQTALPNISLDTVYRTLAILEEHGLLSRLHPLDNKARFDPRTTEHHHFICRACSKITDFEWGDFTSLGIPSGIRSLGKIERKYVELRGLCSDCAKRPKSHRTSA